MKKILLVTDSRGLHKPVGSTHQLYTERLCKVPELDVTLLRCLWQWTTLPDLLSLVDRFGAGNYDHVIVHGGIVDHSPRPVRTMMTGLYDPTPADCTDAETVEKMIAARRYIDRKIVNRKKPMLDAIFGEAAMKAHLARPFDVEYEGEKTINLYSLEMQQASLVPLLKKIPNLVFISSNDFSPGWDGDFTRGRPANIRMIEDYSKALCKALPESSVINLHQWTSEQVREYTCDNLHLSAAGSDWVFRAVLESLGLRRRDYMNNRRSVGPTDRPTPWPLKASRPADQIESIVMDEPEILTPAKLAELQKQVGREGKPLATLVIGLRLKAEESSRLDNLRFLMGWIDKHYGEAFELLLVEQDKQPTADLHAQLPGRFRHEFLYNPAPYNRGWLYNVAVRHLTDAPVVGFIDTDILPGSNFLGCVMDCYRDFDVISPNRNLYYSTAEQKQALYETGHYRDLPVTLEGLRNPTSLSGGMLIVNRQKFIDIAGFEQYVGYGCEDRALDVTMFAMLPAARLRMDSFAYFHQHHPMHAEEHAYFKDIYSHMAEHYGCEYTRGLTPTSYLHRDCCHVPEAHVREMAEARRPFIGDPNLYRRHSFVTINGLPASQRGKLIPVDKPEPVLPPTFTNLRDYHEKERFEGRWAASWAPPVPKDQQYADTEELSFFYNRYLGRRCFIIGNGPSLNKCDLSLLKDEYSFAVNSFYYKTRETGFRPTFFVVEDSSVIKENVNEIREYEAPFKFFPSIYKSLHPKQPGTYFFKLNRGFYEKSSPNYAIPRFSTDITDEIFCGQSVTYVNLQLAFFMGFTEVFLIGMDFNYDIPASHQRTGDVLLSDTDDPNHFHKDYFGKGKTWKDPKLDRVLMNYQQAKLVYECAGRRIYNATVGGKLEAFERVAYDGLFRGLDPRFATQPLDLARPPVARPPVAAPVPSPAPAVSPAPVRAPVPVPAAKPATVAVAAKPLAATAAPPATPVAAPAAAPAKPAAAPAAAGSIAEAHQLLAAGQHAACIRMCDALYAQRGLRIYKDLADDARRQVAPAAPARS
jgi:hypothetical protein